MISGDHVETARRVAIDAGLLNEDHHEDAVLTAAEFREKIGPYKLVDDKENQFKTVIFNDID
jgi:magnesium-transporting ATPase (P-type)